MDKGTIFFSVADDNNLPYYKKMVKTLKHFHPDANVMLFGAKEVAETGDPDIFYRATPFFAKFLFEQGYTRVIKLDADQLILGTLERLLEEDDFDIGTVLNFNPHDIAKFGPISIAGIPIDQYYNNGLVVMRNKEFVDRWLQLCFHPHFTNYQYREQDFLNFLAHYGGFKVRCFDNEDNINNYRAWHGCLNSGEGLNMKVIDGEVILPASPSQYPTKDIKVKVYHFAGAGVEKMKYRLCFSEEVIKFIDDILKGDNA